MPPGCNAVDLHLGDGQHRVEPEVKGRHPVFDARHRHGGAAVDERFAGLTFEFEPVVLDVGLKRELIVRAFELQIPGSLCAFRRARSWAASTAQAYRAARGFEWFRPEASTTARPQRASSKTSPSSLHQPLPRRFHSSIWPGQCPQGKRFSIELRDSTSVRNRVSPARPAAGTAAPQHRTGPNCGARGTRAPQAVSGPSCEAAVPAAGAGGVLTSTTTLGALLPQAAAPAPGADPPNNIQLGDIALELALEQGEDFSRAHIRRSMSVSTTLWTFESCCRSAVGN